MQIEFRRSGDRRYTVVVRRPGVAPLEFAAPGFDPLMPHDLLHLIVERELGMRHGVFGFMAAGGQTGGGPHLAPGEDPRQAARRRAKAARRDGQLLRRGGRDDGPRSERATFICLYEWLRRSADPERRRRAAAMADYAAPARRHLPDDEARALAQALPRICARMDELGARWAALAVGQALTVEWPAPT